MNSDLINRMEALESISKIDEQVVKCAGDMKVLASIHIKELPAVYDVNKVIEILKDMQNIPGWDLITVQECLKIVKEALTHE